MSAALTALIILLPLFVMFALAIWAVDGSSPFYRHRRLGRGQKSFGCLKFRTMRIDSQEALARHLSENPAALAEWNLTRKLKDDPRITPIGHVLRKSSLDELPQLVNIIRGEMSFVGPRPIVEEIGGADIEVGDQHVVADPRAEQAQIGDDDGRTLEPLDVHQRRQAPKASA